MKFTRFRYSSLIVCFLGIAICLAANIFFENSFFDQKSGSNSLSFGSAQLTLSPQESKKGAYLSSLKWYNFDGISSVNLLSHQNYKAQFIDKLEVFVENEHSFAVFSTSNPDQSFWSSIKSRFGAHSTLYIKATDNLDEVYHAVVSDTKDAQIFKSYFLQEDFFNAKTIRLNSSTYKKPSAFLKAVDLSKLKSHSNFEIIQPNYLTNEEAQFAFEQYIDIDTESTDSLEVLIKSENGALHKLQFASDEKIKLKSLMQDHVESSTIYICKGAINDNERRLAILTISDENRISAVHPELLKNHIGIDINNVAFESMVYTPANLDFVWGDMQMRFTKNESGKYFAKKRIAKSEWKKFKHSIPNLLMGNNLSMDSLSYDLTIAIEHKDTMNKVWFENVQSDTLVGNIENSLKNTAWDQDRKNSKSIIKLEDICLLYTSPSPRDGLLSRMPSSA